MIAEPLLVTFLIFLSVAVLVAYLASKVRVPYTIAMVLVGLGVSMFQIKLSEHLAIELEPSVILLLFLPGLLFEASYHIDLSLLRSNLRTILLLAIPGVLLSTTIVGLLLSWELSLPLAVTLLFGVIISATDPIAVVALFRELGVDKRLSTIIEGESLFNDGVAIVGYTILVGIAAGVDTFHLADTVVDFVVTVVGGAGLGLAAGYLVAELMKHTEEPMIDVALTAILAYGTYLFAEEVLGGQISPVIAVVVAGLVVGNYGAQSRHAAESTTMIVTFWEFTAFAIDSAVFLLIGLEVEVGNLWTNIVPLLLAIGTILLARAVVVYTLRWVNNRRATYVPLPWAHVMFWGGMRGAVSIALALSLPLAIESRGLLTSLVFGYVLFSVVVQGLSIRPLLSKLGLAKRSEQQREFERELAKVITAQAASSAIDDLRKEHILSRPLADRLQQRFDDWADRRGTHLFHLVAEEPNLAEANMRLMQQEIANTQKQALRRMLRRGIISDEIYSEFMANIAELQRSPSTVNRILVAELRHSAEQLASEDQPQEA